MPTAEARRQRKRALIVATMALVVSLAANATVAVLLIYTRIQTEDYTACAAQWQQQFSVAYAARSEAASETNDALSKVMLALPRSPDAEFNREAFNEALVDYVVLYQRQVEERENNPLPPLPETLCGKIGGD